MLLVALGCVEPGSWRDASPGAGPGSGVDTAADTATDTGGDSGAPDTGDTAGDSGDSDTAWTLPARPDTDAPPAGVSWRYGGGHGYPDVVDPDWPVVTRVGTLDELSAALAAAAAGQVVFVDADAEIDLTGQSLCIPGGVWLAGDRGVGGSAGGLLYATAGAAKAVLVACGADVRITGLRIRGPDPETCPAEWPGRCPNDVSGDPNCAYCTDTAYAISTVQPGLEVDNNELSGWTYAAVGVKDTTGADVHHNHIHHGWREGLGYGVVIYGTGDSDVRVRWNRFDAMRHVVAGQGYAGEDYEARDNLVEAHAIGHVFDMHGEDEVAGNGSPNAGGDVRVHGNTVLVDNQYSLVLRGRPAVGAWLYDNCLAPARAEAYDQRHHTGNFQVDVAPDGAAAPNRYGAAPADCGTLRWCLADAATGPVRYGSASGTPARELLVGDLDGDGRDEVFGTADGRWRYAHPDGGSWTALASSGAALASLALVDLDGDGTDDVFYADGDAWYVSSHGTSSWARLAESAYTRAEVGFGDFDGDGAMDVFTTDGRQWRYHPRGSGAAVALASASESIDELAFGDFDGDGITDVFSATGAQWRYSRSGSAAWAPLASSSARVAELGFADLDGDGKTDVLNVSGQTLRMSSGGARSWSVVRHQASTLDELRAGDFDGDGRADLLSGECL